MEKICPRPIHRRLQKDNLRTRHKMTEQEQSREYITKIRELSNAELDIDQSDNPLITQEASEAQDG
jgi:hypothetical protein